MTSKIHISNYSPFGVLLQNREFTSAKYSYVFNGQEKDDEIKGLGNSYAYEYRFHDPRLGRFLSVDPLASRYTYNSPYAFSENRLIDGSELEGLEYKSEKNWSDQVSDNDLKTTYGDQWEAKKGITYEKMWEDQAPSILNNYVGQNYDCADLSIYAMVEYAAKYKLPVTFSDYKGEDPTLDNDNNGYYDKNGKWVEIKVGDWQALAKAEATFYGAADLYSTYSHMTTTLYNPFPHTSEKGKGVDNPNLGSQIRPGDMLGFNYPGTSTFHNATVYSCRFEKTTDNQIIAYITVASGNEDNSWNPTPVQIKMYVVKPPYKLTDAKGDPEPKLLRWDFKYFDQNR